MSKVGHVGTYRVVSIGDGQVLCGHRGILPASDAKWDVEFWDADRAYAMAQQHLINLVVDGPSSCGRILRWQCGSDYSLMPLRPRSVSVCVRYSND